MYGFIVSILILFPAIALAQTQQGFDDTIGRLSDVLNTIIVFLILVATVIFLIGIVRYITSANDEDARSSARKLIIWGLIFLAVMLAVWGLTYIIIDIIFDGNTDFGIPSGSNTPQQGGGGGSGVGGGSPSSGSGPGSGSGSGSGGTGSIPEPPDTPHAP